MPEKVRVGTLAQLGPVRRSRPGFVEPAAGQRGDVAVLPAQLPEPSLSLVLAGSRPGQ